MHSHARSLAYTHARTHMHRTHARTHLHGHSGQKKEECAKQIKYIYCIFFALRPLRAPALKHSNAHSHSRHWIWSGRQLVDRAWRGRHTCCPKTTKRPHAFWYVSETDRSHTHRNCEGHLFAEPRQCGGNMRGRRDTIRDTTYGLAGNRCERFALNTLALNMHIYSRRVVNCLWPIPWQCKAGSQPTNNVKGRFVTLLGARDGRAEYAGA